MAKLAPYAVRWRLKHTLPAANEVGELFAALDAAYTKFGQLIASSSFTLLSFIFSKEYMEEYMEEFEQRLDQTSPTPFRLIRKIISADLKRPINRIFDNIQQYLLASTSIAQVHAVILVTIAKYELRG